jgi:mannose-6-phosphate isomerase-like protein (cupin superfamily)
MKVVSLSALLLVALFANTAGAGPEPVRGRSSGGGPHADVRALADVMSKPPFVESKNALRGWVVEKSADFGVVLIEVLGTIPLHMHPDGNRRMFLIEGEMKMRGGDHEMSMKPGDYMYLPRRHHHKVWLAPNSKRALFLLVDNPPTSTKNTVWIEPAPELIWNPGQPASALTVDERCEAGSAKK